MSEKSGKVGKFIKKGDPILDRVSIRTFSFEEIARSPITYPDNSQRNLYLHRLHEHDELEQGVRPPEKFDDNLDEEHLPVLKPLNFTEDWLKEKTRMKRRGISGLDDEDLDLELEEEDEDYSIGDYESPEKEDSSSDQDDASRASSLETQMVESKNFQQNIAPPASDISDNSSASDPSVQESIFSPVNLDLASELHSEVETAEEDLLRSAENVGAFAPTEQEQGNFRDDLRQESAVQSLESMVDMNEDRIQAIVEERASRGFLEGYKAGEEKAVLQVKEQTKEVLSLLSSLVEEFTNLKEAVLNNVQENFYELCQAMAESLLRREFRIDPESFAAVLREAIRKAVHTDQFTVRIHPDSFQALKDLDLDDFDRVLLADESLVPGDFKIDSDLTVVDGDVSKLISEILEKMRHDLFDDHEKVG